MKEHHLGFTGICAVRRGYLLVLLLSALSGTGVATAWSQTSAGDETYNVANVQQNDVLYVRQQPGAGQPAVGSIPFSGRGIRFLGEETRIGQTIWRRVQYSVAGWVNSHYLVAESGGNSYSVIDVAPNDVLYVREQPGAEQPDVGSVPFNGHGVSSLGQQQQVGSSLWLKVQYQVTGWVNSSYLTAAISGVGSAVAAAGPPVLGAADASNTLKLWGSYTCPFTSRLLIDILIPLVQDSNGTVNVEWHHYPIHEPDPSLHVIGLADRGKFWKFLYTVMMAARQDPNMQLNVSMDRIVQLAGAAGISETQVKRAYDDESNWAAVQDDVLAGKLLGIRGTPGLFFAGYFLTAEGMPKDNAVFDGTLRNMLHVPLRQ
jgi:hypothetical protein